MLFQETLGTWQEKYVDGTGARRVLSGGRWQLEVGYSHVLLFGAERKCPLQNRPRLKTRENMMGGLMTLACTWTAKMCGIMALLAAFEKIVKGVGL